MQYKFIFDLGLGPRNPISDRERDEIETSWGLIAEKRGIEAANEWQYYYVRALLRTKGS